MAGVLRVLRLCGRGHDASFGISRKCVPTYEWGFSDARFGQRPAQRPCAVTPLPVSNGSGCALPTLWAAGSWPVRLRTLLFGTRVSGFRHPALVWRDRRTLDDPVGRRPVPAPAWAYAGS